MKLNYLTPLACAALLCGGTIANAQTSSSSSNSSAQSGSTDNPSTGSNTKGNNLDTSSKSPKVDTMSAPQSTGQNKSTGNNMVAPNGKDSGMSKDSSMSSDSSMSQSNASHPDFSTLDTKKSGKLTAADVKSNKWLSKNFAKCDTDHDGSIDKAEYNACH
jgi:hypothetical protein